MLFATTPDNQVSLYQKCTKNLFFKTFEVICGKKLEYFIIKW